MSGDGVLLPQGHDRRKEKKFTDFPGIGLRDEDGDFYSVRIVPGIGSMSAQNLAKRNIHTFGQLLAVFLSFDNDVVVMSRWLFRTVRKGKPIVYGDDYRAYQEEEIADEDRVIIRNADVRTTVTALHEWCEAHHM
jgi:hypothetical protein